MSLAYDLYVLDHHLWLQKKLLSRLRLKDQFCSARYELFVAATCIRAGFQLTYEDEDDRARRHVEFQAIHKVSAQRVLVEAKQSIAAKHNYGKLINDAIDKQGSDPLVIFVDFNKSPARARRYFAQGNPKIQQLLSRIHRAPNGKDLFTLLVFTNHPHRFATKDGLDPECTSLIIEARDPLHTPTDPKIVARLRKAVMQYGNTPKAFPLNP